MTTKANWVETLQSLGIKSVETLDPTIISALRLELENDRNCRAVIAHSKQKLNVQIRKKEALEKHQRIMAEQSQLENIRMRNESIREEKRADWLRRLKDHDARKVNERRRLSEIIREEEDKRQRMKQEVSLAEIFELARKLELQNKSSSEAETPLKSLEAIQKYLSHRSVLSKVRDVESKHVNHEYIRKMEDSNYARRIHLASLVYRVKP